MSPLMENAMGFKIDDVQKSSNEVPESKLLSGS
jgi:hypothetical protein